MFMTQINYKKQQSGFALLITILVLGVVVAVTLAMVELSLKQLKLAVDSTDSEIAFHAANAGLECAQYTRRIESDDFETGNNVTINCFGSSGAVVALTGANLGFTTVNVPSNGQVYRYKRNIDWVTALSARCTTIDIITMIATSSITIGGGGANTLKTRINGYENDTKVCAAGERCTIMSVVGYSSACNATSSSGVLKREILLEL
jgi:Tfp pilus assembly protein PilX